jgi:hypothetical protein
MKPTRSFVTSHRRWILAPVIVALGACAETASTTDAAPPPVDAVDAGGAKDVVTVVDLGAPDVGVEASGIGEPCEAEGAGFPPTQGSCRTGQLCLNANIGFRNGYCVAVCQGLRCAADAICGRIQGFPVCLRRCEGNADCRVADGYVCRANEGVAGRACQVNDAPGGTRPDGAACFTAGAGGAGTAPALARVTFTGPNGDSSSPRLDSFVEAEGNLAVHPTTGHTTVSYIAAGLGGNIFMGTSRSPMAGTGWIGDGTVTDPMFNGSSDPVLDYAADGTLRMTFIGLQRNAASQVSAVHVRIAESRDEGTTWTTPRQVDPNGTCPQTGGGGICDKPWVVSAPPASATAPTTLYLGYLAQSSTAANLLVQRSDDGGMVWSTPVRLASLGRIDGFVISHNLIQLATGPGGLVAAAWSGLSLGDGSGSADGSARFGSPANRVIFRRSLDGFRTVEQQRIVSRPTDSPVYTQPPVAVDGPMVAHVAYVSGDAAGAWDVILATSADGGQTWRHRRVNDDPESCALHMLPAMVVDPVTHAVHVTWMENRFGEGAVAYARCPGDPSMPCGRNEQVSDRGFRLTSSRNPQIWHGDYMGLTLSPQGELWAAWSDTRTGSPAMYTAHANVRP